MLNIVVVYLSVNSKLECVGMFVGLLKCPKGRLEDEWQIFLAKVL